MGRRVESTLQRVKRLGEKGREREGKEDPRSIYKESFQITYRKKAA
jgi:hypothetical protein